MIVTVQAIVMVFGALTAAAGLVLMFLRQESGRNTIKIMGQEFEISTPALVVFLSGCLIFVLPLLRPSETLSQPLIVLGSRAAERAEPGGRGSGGVRVAGKEQEPNTQITEANVIAFATRVQGGLDDDDRDYFRFRTPDGLQRDVRVIVRKLRAGGFYADATLLDGAEKRVKSDTALANEAVTFAAAAKPAAEYYVMIIGGPGPYELEIRED
jgi:hypothetical protein